MPSGNMIEKDRTGRAHDRGYYTSLYMAVFMPLGIALWLVTDNPGLMGAGVAVGAGVGALVECRQRGDFNAPKSGGLASLISVGLVVMGGLVVTALLLL